MAAAYRGFQARLLFDAPKFAGGARDPRRDADMDMDSSQPVA